MILNIVGNVTADIITSDPFGSSNADRAKRPALLPLLVSMPYLTPKNLAASDENNLPSSASCQFLVLREFLIDLIMARSSNKFVTAPPYLIILLFFMVVVHILLYPLVIFSLPFNTIS